MKQRKSHDKTKKIRLPYVDNAKVILITVLINTGIVFLFFWANNNIGLKDVILDSTICAVITTIINMSIVYFRLKKMRAGGQMPTVVPESTFMQRLPKNPIILGLIYALVFGVLIVGINMLILSFFDMQSMSFITWMAYKLIYATMLSVKIAEFCIFRYVQPDWANAKGIEVKEDTHLKPVKDPMPKISVFAAMYASVTGNLALNLIIGSILGGAIVTPEHEVVVFPTTQQGIPITGLVFGCICGALVTRGVMKGTNASLLVSAPEIPESARSDKRFSWMPKRILTMALVICPCNMVFSSVALWLIMKLFGMEVLDFFQFSVFITIYAAIMSKPLSYIITRRCTQPDYIRHLVSRDG